jgi:hypothetical protein
LLDLFSEIIMAKNSMVGNKKDLARELSGSNPNVPKGITKSPAPPKKSYSPPPQSGGGKADKVVGTPGAKTAVSVSGLGGSKKLGNHYSNS